MALILIVDDEENNRIIYRQTLEREGFHVLTAGSAQEARLAVVDSEPDLILCDVSMPRVDGVTFCRELKADKRLKTVPVILMSGVFTGTTEQVEGIELGAEDYLAKPIAPALLATKVRAVLRRCETPVPSSLKTALKKDGLEVDLGARLATLKGRRLPLTRKEFDLLTNFMRRPGQVMSPQHLLETVWGYDTADYNDPHTVNVHVSSLRKKLGPKLGKRVVSVPALGYRFEG